MTELSTQRHMVCNFFCFLKLPEAWLVEEAMATNVSLSSHLSLEVDHTLLKASLLGKNVI